MTPSMSLKPSRCAPDILVIKAIVGLEILQSCFISPTALAPISITATSQFSFIPRILNGTPM